MLALFYFTTRYYIGAMTRSGSNEGLTHQKNINNFVNGKKINELKECNLKKFLLFIIKNRNIKFNSKDILRCSILGPQKGIPQKSDLKITISGSNSYISLKKGTGNSYHQEQLTSFANFLKSLGASNELIKTFKTFICSSDYKTKINQTKKNNMQNFFKIHKEKIIHRAVIKGSYNHLQEAEFFYHCDRDLSTFKDGHFLDRKKLLKILIVEKNNTSAFLPVGQLTLQAYERKKDIDDIQFKGPSYQDLKWL